jgi:hypothetical protein
MLLDKNVELQKEVTPRSPGAVCAKIATVSEPKASAHEEPPAGARPQRSTDDMFMGIAASAITFAMVCVLIGAVIGALALSSKQLVDAGFVSASADVWKARVRLMSVSAGGLYGADLIAVSLLVALGLARGARRTSLVVTAVVGTTVWLGILMVLNLYVDITDIGSIDIAIGTVLGDLAALVMLAVAGAWGFTLAGTKRR